MANSKRQEHVKNLRRVATAGFVYSTQRTAMSEIIQFYTE